MTVFSSLFLAITVTVSNPLSIEREAVPVIVPINSKTEVNSAIIKNHPDIKYQLDDMNDDGNADEMVFLVDLKANETKSFTIDFSSAPQKEKETPGTRAYIKLNDKNKKHPPIQAIAFPGDANNKEMYNSIYGHGAVLEGIYNAIRVYMDNRQSVDLYAKNTPQLELEETGFYTTREQLAQGFGRDVLWAGTSVALGSFRGYQDNAPVTIDTVTTRMQRVVVSGPVRSIIEVVDRGWIYNGRPIEMSQRYTIYDRHRDFDVDINLSDASESNIYCTGVQKLAIDNIGFIDTDGLAGSWGSNIPDNNMKDIADTIGLGIYVPAPYLRSVKEDDVNYLTLLRTDKNGKISYSFISAALRDSASPHSADEWFAYLRKWKTLKASPIRVTVK